MATKYVYISGEAMYSRNIYFPDSYAGGPEYYKVNLTLDDENLKVFKEAGIRTKVRESGGKPLVTLKRNAEPNVLADGKALGGGRPDIVDKEGNEVEALIGDGSEITVKVAVYDTRSGMGHRVETIRVDNLVPYVSEKRETNEEPSTKEDGSKVKPRIPF